MRSTFLTLVPLVVLAFASLPANAQQQTTAPAPGNVTIQRLHGVWVEGPGYDIKYGAGYETCAARCAAEAKCLMIEYYRPEKKCNLYDAMRPTVKGGSSSVAVKRQVSPTD